MLKVAYLGSLLFTHALIWLSCHFLHICLNATSPKRSLLTILPQKASASPWSPYFFVAPVIYEHFISYISLATRKEFVCFLQTISGTWKWKWKSLSRVRLFATPYSPWNSAGQNTRILEWAAIISFSRGSSQPRDQTQVSHVAGGFFTSWATTEAPEVLH